MNKDLDDRLVPKGEYRDAQNISVGRSEDDDIGALETVLGNVAITNLNDTNVKAIGTIADEGRKQLYVFYTDYSGSESFAPSTSKHYIYIYIPGDGTFKKIVEGSFLNFHKDYPISGISLIEELLFWTDNRNQPRKINITRSLGYYTLENQISVAKYNPYEVISLVRYSQGTIATTSVAPHTSLELSSLAGTSTTADASTASAIVNITLANTLIKPGMLIGGTGVVGFCQVLSVAGTVLNLSTIQTLGSGVVLKFYPYFELYSKVITSTITPSYYQYVSVWNPVTGFITLNTIGTTPSQVAGTTISFLKSGMTNQEINDATWPGDPDYLEDKFVRFSYRFKFDDGEYSIMAPFTQIAFIPKQQGYFIYEDQDDAYRSTILNWMENNVQNVELLVPLPDKAYKLGTENSSSYKIIGIDLLYKESDGIAVKVLESVPISTINCSECSATKDLTYFSYNYQSRKPFKTLPTVQTTRVYDKVPVRALAQETAGNRIIYGNFWDQHTPPVTLDYQAGVSNKLSSVDDRNFIEYPNHSLKQNRTYQVGFVLADKFGRQSSVILSSIDENLTIINGISYGGSTVFNPYDSQTITTDNNVVSGSVNLVLASPNKDIKVGMVVTGVGVTGVTTEDNVTITTVTDSSNFILSSAQTIPVNSTLYYNKGITGEWFGNALQLTINSPINSGKLNNNITPNYPDTSTGEPGLYAISIGTGTGFEVGPIGGSPKVSTVIGNTYEATIDTTILFTLTTAGTGYITMMNLPTTVSPSGGTGLLVTIVADGAGHVTSVTIPTPTGTASGYEVGDVVTIISGNSDATITLTSVPITPADNIPTTGNFLRGENVDYTEIISLTHVPATSTYTFTTNEDINVELYSATTATIDSKYGYILNPMGWYSYKVVVKQTEQDYYNVYLPGILNGYPEQPSPATITTTDNLANGAPGSPTILYPGASTSTTFNNLVGGTGYSTDVAVATTPIPTGGAGLTVNTTVTLGIITAVSIVSPGSGYSIGDVLTILGTRTTDATITLTAVPTDYAGPATLATSSMTVSGGGLIAPLPIVLGSIQGAANFEVFVNRDVVVALNSTLSYTPLQTWVDFPTDENGETANIVLINDNINKVPRDLNEVGPQQRQFRSSVQLFGRVNNDTATSNVQYYPGTSTSTAVSIASSSDAGMDADAITELADGNLYQIESNPLIARLSISSITSFVSTAPVLGAAAGNSVSVTLGSINSSILPGMLVLDNASGISYGIVTSVSVVLTSTVLVCNLYTAIPASQILKFESSLGIPTGIMKPYLAIFETEPVDSLLDLYWETSSSGLISDINAEILGGAGGGGGTNFGGCTQFNHQGSALFVLENSPIGHFVGQALKPLDIENNFLPSTSINMKVINGDGVNVTDYFQLIPITSGAFKGEYDIKTAKLFNFLHTSPTTDVFTFHMEVTVIGGTVDGIVNTILLTSYLQNIVPQGVGLTTATTTNDFIGQIADLATFTNGSIDTPINNLWQMGYFLTTNATSHYFEINPYSGALNKIKVTPNGSYSQPVTVTDGWNGSTFASGPQLNDDSLTASFTITITTSGPPTYAELLAYDPSGAPTAVQYRSDLYATNTIFTNTIGAVAYTDASPSGSVTQPAGVGYIFYHGGIPGTNTVTLDASGLITSTVPT